jgi:hypothetical protein
VNVGRDDVVWSVQIREVVIRREQHAAVPDAAEGFFVG